MKRIAILGSTGSIGVNALKVIRHFPDRFQVTGLSTNSSIDILYEQIKEFRPLFVCVGDAKAGRELKGRLKPSTRLLVGKEGLEALAADAKVDEVLLAISGFCALSPLLKAIESGKQVALANKEALVAAGSIVMNRAASHKVNIIPVDSEQSAIWQCLEGERLSGLKKIYLTASGGPFWQARRQDLKSVTIKKVLDHPRWKMGKKISVDSASLMNKGLELLEAMFLFNVASDKIEIILHPEAVVHSMVEFIDGSILAQLSATDMRIPIQYAFSYPERLPNASSSIDFCKLRNLHFQAPDFRKFPCLGLAYRAADELGTMPAVLNAANEVSVEAFLNKKIKFVSIPKVIEKVLDSHRNKLDPDLSDILHADEWARLKAHDNVRRLN
ncbi:MAG: 1-deoxy-D-xylulose-5-phosphate reductoisomerase [Candidatus Omnitrophota bacterium]